MSKQSLHSLNLSVLVETQIPANFSAHMVVEQLSKKISYESTFFVENQVPIDVDDVSEIRSPLHSHKVAAALAPGHVVVATLTLHPRAQRTPEERTTLGSGIVRHQWGLGIGPDACNKLYVMHRSVEGDFARAELAIQIKSNPGLSSSAQCQNRGYSPTSVHYTGPDLGVLAVARSDDGNALRVRAYDLFGATLLSTDYSAEVPQHWNGSCAISLRGDNCFADGVITV